MLCRVGLLQRAAPTVPTVLLLALGAGCSRKADPQSDDDTVPVVDVRPLEGEEVRQWPVPRTPTLVIAAEDSEPETAFFGIQGGLVISDGRIVVADESSGALKVFDPSGRFVRTVGQRGEGPGEFESPFLAGRIGSDTMLVVDPPLRRVSLLHADDGFLGSWLIPASLPPFFSPLGSLEDGTVIVRQREMFRFPTAPGGHTLQDTLGAFSISPDGTGPEEFGRFPGPELFLRVSPGGNRGGLKAFGHQTRFAVGSDRIYVGPLNRSEIEVYDAAGSLIRIFRLADPGVRVVPEDLDRARAELVDRYGAGRSSELESLYRDMPIPEHFPAFGELKVDPKGRLWVQEYPMPRRDDVSWTILNKEGWILAQTVLPRALEVLDIGTDFILGVLRNELAEEQVVRFTLNRQGAARGGG